MGRFMDKRCAIPTSARANSAKIRFPLPNPRSKWGME